MEVRFDDIYSHLDSNKKIKLKIRKKFNPTPRHSSFIEFIDNSLANICTEYRKNPQVFTKINFDNTYSLLNSCRNLK